LNNGEWISELDSTSGISVRMDYLSFYENNKFTSDSVYEYRIVDSIADFGSDQKRIGRYLFRMGAFDSLYTEIHSINDSILTLINKGQIKKYSLKK